MVEVQNTEEMGILPALLAAYISKLGCFGPYSLRIFFSALDVYMTRRTHWARWVNPGFPFLGWVGSG